jgi:hypothetical protein
LRGGGTVNATVRFAAKADALTVPEQSVVLRPPARWCMSSPTSKARRRRSSEPVKAGAKRGGRIEILEGLKGGETIALDGAGFLTNNAAVAIKEAAKPGAAGTRARRYGDPKGSADAAKPEAGADATAKKADPAAQPTAK